MWGITKQELFDELRRRRQEGTLTDEEYRVLEQLFYELEQEEWATLRPALERLRQEQKQLQEQWGRVRAENAVLAALAQMKEILASRGIERRMAVRPPERIAEDVRSLLEKR